MTVKVGRTRQIAILTCGCFDKGVMDVVAGMGATSWDSSLSHSPLKLITVTFNDDPVEPVVRRPVKRRHRNAGKTFEMACVSRSVKPRRGYIYLGDTEVC